MPLAPGQTLLHYRLIEKIGEGGMGEVWRATDTTLGREVAIKVLPAAFTTDPERMARFEREAKVLASLNHPGIAAIYGLHQDASTRFLAMEKVEGEDLSQRLARGAIPLDEANTLARQIAEALEYAHERGIVHRDLKPANVKVTPDGGAKVLDFGLAKAIAGDTMSRDSASTPTVLPTVTSAETAAGIILGTAAYMSPEQARGKPVDKRTDIWAFGVVVYEMLTGKRLFEGETISDTLAAVLRQEVSLAALPAETPPRRRRMIARCLEREPKNRLRDIGEARVVLEGRAEDDALATTSSPSAAVAPRRSPVPLSAALLVAAIGGALAGAWGWSRLHQAPKAPMTSLSITLPPGQVLSGNGGPAITRDGRLVAYTARDASGVARLYLRPLDRFETSVVPESEGAQQPFFSPDGTRVGFFARGKLHTASVSGGAPTPIADVSNQPMGATWGDDGSIVFAPSLARGLLRVPAGGGKIEQITEPDEGAKGYAHARPQFLPGSHSILFTTWGGQDSEARGNVVYSLDKKTWTHVFSTWWSARYAPSGHLLLSSPRGVQAVRFDPEHPGSVSPETFVLEDVFSTIAWSDSWFDVASNGTLVYVPGEFLLGTPAWLDMEGRVTPLLDKPIPVTDPMLSPDGGRIAVQDRDDSLWTIDLRRGTRVHLTQDSDGTGAYPLWSRDGTRVYFGSNRGGDWDIYWVAASGGPATKVLTRKGNQFPSSFAPDGTLMFSERSRAHTGVDVLTLAPDGTVTPFLDDQPAGKTGGQFSPDGRLVAYVSDESGREEVYVRTFRPRGDAVAVSTEGGLGPCWSPDGKTLYFRHADAFLAAPVTFTGATLTVGNPRKLFDSAAAPGRSFMRPGYSVSPDGQRFLVHMQDPRAIPTRINVVEGWTEALNGKVK